MGLRHAVERRSAVLLVFLRRLPRPLPGLLLLGLVAAGLLVRGPGGTLALATVALLLAWLAYLSWPAVRPVGRAVLLATLALVVAGAIGRLAG